jgi:adenylate cyclase
LQVPTLTRRDLRLYSGLVLFTYIALHLTNHALGLVSIAFAERGLRVAMSVWQSVPGTLLLYGAAGVHVVLALLSIYERRTLRMPPLELLRIVLGLGIPTLLIGHAVTTRIAWEQYAVSSDYHHVVWSLWTSNGQGRQLALLVPGWLHGCLGVYFAFGRRRWYRQLRYVLFAAALLLPVLGGLGFLAMGKELSADAANRIALDVGAGLHAQAGAALAHLREMALAIYVGAIALVFAAREIRAIVERRTDALVAIAYPRQTVRVPRGWTVLEASRSHHIPHLSMCGGRARCSTCRISITSGANHCPPPEPAERSTLRRIGAPPDVRLACQLCPTGDIAIVPLLSADARVIGAGRQETIERRVALIAVTWHDRAAFAQGRLPQDVVFMSRLFAETVGADLRAAGADAVDVAGDGVLCVFGLSTALMPAARKALVAVESLQRVLDHLETRCNGDFNADARLSVCVHVGHAAVGYMGAQDARRPVVAGEAMQSLQIMCANAGDRRTVISDAVFEAAAKTRPGGNGPVTQVTTGTIPRS